jgi:hypothetical protein
MIRPGHVVSSRLPRCQENPQREHLDGSLPTHHTTTRAARSGLTDSHSSLDIQTLRRGMGRTDAARARKNQSASEGLQRLTPAEAQSLTL